MDTKLNIGGLTITFNAPKASKTKTENYDKSQPKSMADFANTIFKNIIKMQGE